MQWRRPDVLALATHLGLRNAGWVIRAVLPRPVAAIDAAPEASHMGRKRLLHADARNRLPDAVRPSPAYPVTGPECSRLGCLGRPRLLCGAALCHGGRPCDRRHL